MSTREGEPVSVGITASPVMEQLSQLFGEHHRRVLRAAYRITGSMADAEDVTQSVFLRLARDGSYVANASSYLYRAAINGSLDLLRRRKTACAEPLEEAAGMTTTAYESSPEFQLSSRELGEALRNAISELSPRAAEMFALRYLEERGNREIAALMRTSQAVVAVTLHHARSKLKKRLIEMNRGRR